MMVVCSGNQQHNGDSCSNDGGSSDLDNYARRYNRLWYQFIYNLAKMGTLIFQNSITNFCHDLWIENQQSWSNGSRWMEMCHQGKGYWSRVHGVSILTKVLSRGTHLKSNRTIFQKHWRLCFKSVLNLHYKTRPFRGSWWSHWVHCWGFEFRNRSCLYSLWRQSRTRISLVSLFCHMSV